jgi:hypothetical protein
MWSSICREHVLWCHGGVVSSGEEFIVANIYAPCDSRTKQGLWTSLTVRLQLLAGARMCVCGDFNAARSNLERRSSRVD